jgi:hypothetical protein
MTGITTGGRAMTGKCAAGVWMVGVGVSLRDSDPRVLGVLLLVLIFLNILPSGCPDGDMLTLL